MTQFELLKELFKIKSYEQQEEAIELFVDEIISTDNKLLSIDKVWVNYGLWKAKVFVNKYHFGKELAQIIKDSIDGTGTHDEEKVFEIKDFKEKLIDEIKDYLYFILY